MHIRQLLKNFCDTIKLYLESSSILYSMTKYLLTFHETERNCLGFLTFNLIQFSFATSKYKNLFVDKLDFVEIDGKG